MTNAYDRVRYPSLAAAKTHPAVLGAFAKLFGKPFAPSDAARVLEIGCGEGINLINMALCAPQSEFVGIDLAETAIAAARATAKALALQNVRFDLQDIVRLDRSLGRFDYIIAHGVYAWTPAAVSEALMRLVGQSLSEVGLAFISYNAYPGARFRQILREMMLSVAGDVADPEEKLGVARSVLAHMAEIWSRADPFQNALQVAARNILERPLGSLFHDELGEHYEPRLLSDVIAAARKVGLDYLCDTKADLCAEALFPSEKSTAAPPYAKRDWASFEQLSDFSEMRFFRNSIFCRGGDIDRRLEAGRLRGLWAYGDLRPAERDPQSPDATVFATEKGSTISTNSVKLIKLIERLAAASPAAIPLDEAAEAPDLAAAVLRLFVAKLVRLRTAPFALTTTPGDRPAASALARLQAAR
ncbi:MAG TPA: class I SAM-dependent methyltransferase, partial [Roseiarcus sp.]|nr:class I SAM-dependent methyltransferase [Roseiarcus sp.]